MLARFTQHGKYVPLVVIDGEFRHFRIWRVALIEAVNVARVVAGADARAADVHAHLRRREDVVQNGFALGLRELREDVTSRIRHGRAEAEDLLTRVAGIDDDGISGEGADGFPLERNRSSVAVIAEGAPDLDGGTGRLGKDAAAA